MIWLSSWSFTFYLNCLFFFHLWDVIWMKKITSFNWVWFLMSSFCILANLLFVWRLLIIFFSISPLSKLFFRLPCEGTSEFSYNERYNPKTYSIHSIEKIFFWFRSLIIVHQISYNYFQTMCSAFSRYVSSNFVYSKA